MTTIAAHTIKDGTDSRITQVMEILDFCTISTLIVFFLSKSEER